MRQESPHRRGTGDAAWQPLRRLGCDLPRPFIFVLSATLDIPLRRVGAIRPFHCAVQFMTVTHKLGVQNYDTVMRSGGSHCYEITSDEMPVLEGFEKVEALEIGPSHHSPLTTWGRIAREIVQNGGYCLYTRIPAGLYEVVCVFPSRSG